MSIASKDLVMSSACSIVAEEATNHLCIRRESAMREQISNAGKKEQRQINQLLNKQEKKNRAEVRDVESSTITKKHKPKKRKTKQDCTAQNKREARENKNKN